MTKGSILFYQKALTVILLVQLVVMSVSILRLVLFGWNSLGLIIFTASLTLCILTLIMLFKVPKHRLRKYQKQSYTNLNESLLKILNNIENTVSTLKSKTTE